MMRIKSEKMREQLLKAGLKLFAERGYAGTSVQDIIDATKVTKPVLYYYFKSKAGLYQALLDEAMDEGYGQMQEAVALATGVEGQLAEIFTAQFEFLRKRRDLVRLAFGAAFASPGELPPDLAYLEKGQRNLDLVNSLIEQAQVRGELTKDFSSWELAYGIYGALCFHMMVGAVRPEAGLNRDAAVRIVRLFLKGAEPKGLKSQARAVKNKS